MHIQLFGPSIDGLKPLIIAGDAFPTPMINVFPPFSGFGMPFFFTQNCTAVKGLALSTAAS